MTTDDTTTDSSDLVHGPVDYVIVEFATANADGHMAQAVIDLIHQGIINVLDVAIVQKTSDDDFTEIDLEGLVGDKLSGVAPLAGLRSGLIDASDLADAAGAVAPGTAAAVIVYENTWAVPFVNAAHRSGAQLVASGRISADALLASIDALG
jgi:hypothetical protein